MGPPVRRRLGGWLAGLGLAVVLGGAAVWSAPWVARLVVQTQRGGGSRDVEVEPAKVDAFLARALPQVGAVRALSSQERDGVVYATWQLRPDQAAADAAAALRTAARDAHIELHAVPRDQLDAELRIYAGSRLRQELQLIPSLPPASPPPRAVNRRERPMVAFVLAGLGEREATALVRTPAPLTVAVRPYTPFALATAQDAAQAWQEVLVQLDEDGPSAADALAAVPYASGVLALGNTTDDAIATLETGVLVVDRGLSATLPPGLLLLQPWRARRRHVDDVLARIRHLALKQGRTAVLLDPDAPSTPALLQWATEGHARGYRIMLASELARPDDVIGMLDVDNPRAHRD